MFEKDSYIIYGSVGVCKIADITTLNIDGVSNERMYYVLEPLRENGSKIYTPTDNKKIIMRPILTKEEATELVDDILNIEELWISNEKQREENYKEAIRSCDCREWVKIIKSLYMRKQERIKQGKKLTSMDERYLKMVENNLYTELSIPLNIPKEEMFAFIQDRVDEIVEAQ